VFLFPDLSNEGKAFELWIKKANQIQRRLQRTYFKVSDLLERLAPKLDKKKGNDLADYLIKLDWRLFRNQCIKNTVASHLHEMPIGVKGEKSVAV